MITRKMVIPPQRPHGSKQALVPTAVCFLIANALWGREIGWNFGQVVLAAGLFAVCYFVSISIQSGRLWREIEAKVRQELKASAVGQTAYIDAAVMRMPSLGALYVSATGIASDGQRVYIVDQGELGVIPWADVRSWEWRIEGYATTQALGGILNRHSAEISNMNRDAKLAAEVNSGLFVKVAEVHRPVWHYQSADKRILERWNEVFTQMREGKLAAAE